MASEGEFDIEYTTTRVDYVYDTAGRRILKRGNRSASEASHAPAAKRTRFFFTGLTESVKKQSIKAGAYNDGDFAFTEKENGDSASEWAVYDTTPSGATITAGDEESRRSNVIRLIGGDGNDFIIGDNNAGTLNPNDGPWNSTAQVLSFWYRGGFSPLTVYVSVSSGQKELRYYTTSGTSGADGSGNVDIYLGAAAASTSWQRFERRIEEDWDVYSAASYTNVDGLLFRPVSTFSFDLHLDDIRLTNAVTVEHNTLGPGVIGHIMRHRTIGPSTMAAADRWFHYDQVGSVLCETNASGADAQRHDQDAFGNTLDTWQNGLIGGDQAGWHHNTKEYDADTGLVYMYQRWYSSEVGTFRSQAPYNAFVEPPYSFAANSPMGFVDPSGRIIKFVGRDMEEGKACLSKLKSCKGTAIAEIIQKLERYQSDETIVNYSARFNGRDPRGNLVSVHRAAAGSGGGSAFRAWAVMAWAT